VRDLGVRNQWLLLGVWAVIYLAIGIKIRLAERSPDLPAP